MNMIIWKIPADKRQKLFSALCFLCVYIFGVSLSPAENGKKSGKNEALTIGTGAIVDGNLALAKENAITQALTKGMENYLLLRLGQQDASNNFQRFVTETMPNAKESIENFHILAEYITVDKYKVLVQLKINEKIIDERLSESGFFLLEGPPVKVLFMVSETEDEIPFYWWKDPEVYSDLTPVELALHNAFQKRGLSPINRTLTVPESKYYMDLRAFDLPDVDVLKWGELFAADVVVYGQAYISGDKGASLALNVINVNSAAQICQGFQADGVDKDPEGGMEIEKIIENQVNRLAERLAPSIIRSAADDYSKIYMLEITLKGLRNFRDFRTFREFLNRDVKGVESVKQTRVKRNSMSIAIEFQGDMDKFLNRILNHQDLPFPLNLQKSEEGEVFLDIGRTLIE